MTVPSPFYFQSELFEDHDRGTAMSYTATVNWLSNLVVTLTFLPLSGMILIENPSISPMSGAISISVSIPISIPSPSLDSIGEPNLFVLFSCISALSLAFCYAVVPETKGKTFEEIETLLGETVRSRSYLVTWFHKR